MIPRNPGVALVWVSRTWKPFSTAGLRVTSKTVPPSDLLFNVGDPIETRWYAHGREATRAEVLASIESGLPALRDVASSEGPKAQAVLDSRLEQAMRLVPA